MGKANSLEMGDNDYWTAEGSAVRGSLVYDGTA